MPLWQRAHWQCLQSRGPQRQNGVIHLEEQLNSSQKQSGETTLRCLLFFLIEKCRCLVPTTAVVLASWFSDCNSSRLLPIGGCQLLHKNAISVSQSWVFFSKWFKIAGKISKYYRKSFFLLGKLWLLGLTNLLNLIMGPVIGEKSQ